LRLLLIIAGPRVVCLFVVVFWYSGKQFSQLDGFVAGERALALRILKILNDRKDAGADEAEAVEDEMVLSLGRT
jgi:hypothetical protein